MSIFDQSRDSKLMKLPSFKLEEFWKKYEFSVPHLLCCSDTESWALSEILALADSETKSLWDSLRLGYTEAPGHPLLRGEIAFLYRNLSENQVMTFAGAEEGIYCALQVLIEPGDHFLVVEPCYQSMETLPVAFGGELSRVRLRAEHNWQLRLEEVESALRENTKLLILNYPHNPTGTLLDPDVFEGIVKLAKERGAYIFCDEVYRYLEIDETKRLPSIVDAYERGIALNVMTKSFGLAGLRVGWLACRENEFLNQALSYKLYTSICNSAPSEILALIALRNKQSILGRNRKILLDNLQILDSFMHRYAHILDWVPPQAGSITLLELLLPQPVEEFAEQLVKEQGVLVMPGSVLSLPGNYFRVGFGRRNMPEVLEHFEKFLKSYR